MKASLLVLFLALVATGCSDIESLSSTETVDTTQVAAYADASVSAAGLLSAFYGLDDAIPFLASYRICGEFGHKDGMPVIFATEVDVASVQAGDFSVELADGQKVGVACATPAPAEDSGELRTILLIGDFGSIDNQPVSVTVSGNVIALDHQTNYQGSSVPVTSLEEGPVLVFAEVVPEVQWDLGKEATRLRFGGGDSCPATTQQVIRVTWSGGVTKPGGDEIDDLERLAYRLIAGEEGKEPDVITPFAIGDLGDGDNNHELCLDVDTNIQRIEFPENMVTDPREDLNSFTSITVSQ